MTKDVNMWIASCSKFPTSVAAMQCVERGQLSLDDDVTGVLPELKGLKILKKFDEGAEPVFVENTKPITLRSVVMKRKEDIEVLIHNQTFSHSLVWHDLRYLQ